MALADLSLASDTHDVASVSAVIATLGGESLRGTVEHLNQGTVVPAEILICIPEEYAHRINGLDFPNIRVVRTPFRGQVAQRAEGFRYAEGPFVLQLDDDVHVRAGCLASLRGSVASSACVAAGPKLYDIRTGKYQSYLAPAPAGPTRLEALLYWIINGKTGFQPGKISAAGVGMGLPECPGTWQSVDWLPGGCVLHRKEHLVLEDFYPFAGKAWAEDQFHSRLLRARGVRLMRCGDAACDLDLSSSSFAGVGRFARDYLEHSTRMVALARENRSSVLRLCLFLFLNLFNLIARRLRAFRSRIGRNGS